MRSPVFLKQLKTRPMKNLLYSLMLSLFCLCSFAQENNATANSKNEIGFNLTDLINGTFQISYERLVGNHLTLGLGMAYKGEKGLFRLSGLKTDNIETGDLTYSGLKLIPEVRYYLKKTQQNSMDGFYFGAFIKHSRFSSDITGNYTDDQQEVFAIDFDAKLRITSVGFMVGYKLPVSSKLSLDFLIAGPGAGFHSYTLTNREPLPDAFYDDLNEALDQYSLFDFINGDFEFRVDNERTKFTVPAFRYGVSLDYSF